MRTFLIILVMVTLTNMAKAADLNDVAPNAHGDSYEEVLEDSTTLKQCQSMIDQFNFDSSTDIYENAHDLCVNKDFEN